MKVTITGSLGNISKPLTESLIAAGNQVTVISNNENRKAAIEALGAKAAIGSIDDVDFLAKAFEGADAVYTMLPPDLNQPYQKAYATLVGNNYATAIKAEGVKKVVNLSSIGGHLEDGTGPIKRLHLIEKIFNDLDGIAVKHLRPGFFYINFFANIDMVKRMNILGANFAGDTKVILVHPKDIAAAAVEEFQSDFTGKSVRYIASDERTADDIATALGTAVGKPDLKWIAFTNEQALSGMTQAGLPNEIAQQYVEMNAAANSGKLWEDYKIHKPILSKIKLEEFAKEFAKEFAEKYTGKI